MQERSDCGVHQGNGWPGGEFWSRLGFWGVEQAMCFLRVFLFWWGPTYTFGFWGNSRFLDVLLGSVFKCGVLGIGMPSGKDFSIFPSLSLFAIIKIPGWIENFPRMLHLVWFCFGFSPFPATEDELETQRQEGSCWRPIDFLLTLYPLSKFQRVFPWNGRVKNS